MALELRQNIPDNAQPGLYGTPGGGPPVGSTPLSNLRLYALRFVPVRDKLIVSGAYGLGVVASVDDALDIGWYECAVGGALLAHSGSTLAKLNGSAGRRVLPMLTPTWLRAGVPYYSALVAAVGGTAAQVGTWASAFGQSVDLFGVGDGTAVAPPHLEAGFAANGSTTLPATLPTLATITSAPVIAWRDF